MMLLNDFGLIQNFQIQTKKKYGVLIHNFFKDSKWITNAINDENLYYLMIEDVCFMIKEERDFRRLYYFSPSYEKLNSALNYFSTANDIYIIERINQNPDTYVPPNFELYGKLIRLSNLNCNHFNDQASMPDNSDIMEILRIQHALFNKYIDEHLSYNDIRCFIDSGNIIIERGNSTKISGFVLYNIKGIRAHLVYIAVDKSIARKGTGQKLMKAFLAEAKTCKFVTIWCRADNEYALSFYDKFGFKEDGTKIDFFYNSSAKNIVLPLQPLN